MARKTLTSQQQIFLAELVNNGGNATEAYRIAFPEAAKSPSVGAMASRLKAHPLVQAGIAEAQAVTLSVIQSVVDRYQITAERVADELARLAFTRLDQLADVTREVDQAGKIRLQVHVKPFAETDKDAIAAIVEVKRTAGGEVSIKLADKRAALMDIARLKGWIADKPVDNRNLVVFKVER